MKIINLITEEGKYDLKKIMKKAWELKKYLEISFRTALRYTWMMAKEEKELKGRSRLDGDVSFNIWCSFGIIRAYYKCSWYSKYANSKRNHYVSLMEK